jgi:hypothetical protein
MTILAAIAAARKEIAMLPTINHSEDKELLNRRLESFGWGLFLLILGVLWLFPEGILQKGAWLIAAGVIMLGVNVVRYLNAIKLSGSSLMLGFLALLFGVGEFMNLNLPFVAILLIAFGIGIILRPWIEPLLEKKPA